MVRKEERREGRGARDPASPRPLSRPSGRAASRLGLPGRYIGGIFQIYYPLICYIGEREREREGELHYFFVGSPMCFPPASFLRKGPPLPTVTFSTEYFSSELH